ncbi:MAG: C4-dicarboxylate ABC transporter substrate-binding protein [Azoarcus sp.]|uniref:C4-dicarboxylate ABC transporter substrate-binding protein n=1 Tax=Parazoarcus communis TaxID=41977 RepID=A0A2U8GLK4_9RHOO|nr:TRAP transporter substrate-binding protein [Parazoarcus communis]AWI74348.1 C4-dicarboxylate ABC transporter substrate-binding protein [Parazoarcus communis]PLX77623.1 MAG: C4-dicarboxylate ABC transporter substrate-binding protein [Azoarcus sp.]TVT53215.1 MAG: TRAP transporter substrate-binding protein [Azoarcus sp. PHD]|tara:strand:- start:48903 stop:49898 length:996 start_codon:yes stop_codon:yes gene_type:complete
MNIKKTVLISFLTAGLIAGSQGAFAANFKMALGDAAGGTQWELGQTFKTLFEQKTGGKHKVDLFPNGQLGDEQNTVNNAALGTLDFSVLAVNNVTPFSPSVGVLTLPYVIQSAEEAKKLTQGDVGKELTENTIRDAGVRIVGWAYSGFRVLTNSKKPVTTVADLKGLVVRVPKNEIMIATYQSWGINPTPMAWSETFTALQQRVVDGQDNPYITVSAMKFNEVQKYVTNIRYIFSLEPLIVSESVFQDQKPDVQKAILEAGREATEHSYKYLLETEDKIKKDLAAKGMQISDAANGEKEFIQKATTTVWPKFYDSIGGKDKLDKVLKSLGR